MGQVFSTQRKRDWGVVGSESQGTHSLGAKRWPTSSQTHLAPCPCLAQNAYNSRDYLRVKGP